MLRDPDAAADLKSLSFDVGGKTQTVNFYLDASVSKFVQY